MQQPSPSHTPSNNSTSTNLASSSPQIPTSNPNPNFTSTASLSAPNSPTPMSSSNSSSSSLSSPSSLTTDANKENICPLTGFAANSAVSPKRTRRRFVRKPLADITNQFQHTISVPSSDGASVCTRDMKKVLKRKAADEGLGNDAKMSCCRSKILRINFR